MLHKAKPPPTASIAQKTAYVQSKYELRRFVAPCTFDEACQDMWRACAAVRCHPAHSMSSAVLPAAAFALALWLWVCWCTSQQDECSACLL